MRHFLSGLWGLSLLAIIAATPSMASAQRSQQERALPRAAELVDRYREVVSYCAPCGDVAPGIPFRASGKSAVLMRGTSEVVVVVNGREMPLQTTYLRTEPGWYRNLAVLLDVPAPGAAASLRVEHAGTAGELITAGAEGPERETEVATFAASGAAQATEPSAGESSVMIVSRGEPGAATLAVLALLVSGVAIGGMFWILLALRIRRRRSMRPRAIHLPK